MNEVYSNYVNDIVQCTIIDGLNVQVIKRKSPKVYFGINVFAGSKDNVFYLDDKLVKLPSGIAHLVEHLLFNLPNKKIINELTNQGLDINGSTAHSGTNYFIGGSKDVLLTNKHYQVLFDIVYKLNFKNLNFTNEQQIVSEEANLEYNSKEYKVEKILGQQLYKYGLKDTIVGNKKDLNKINYNDVVTFYNNFYTFSNSMLTIIGDFTNQEIEQILKDIRLIIKTIKKQQIEQKHVIKKIEEKTLKLKKRNFLVKSNTINTKICEYYLVVDLYDNINIKELKVAIDFLLSLWNEDFNIDFLTMLHKYDLSSNDFDFWYKNYNEQQIIIIIEMKNKVEICDEIFEMLKQIFKTKLTKLQFKYLKKSHLLSQLERQDENVEDFTNDYLSHIQFYNTNFSSYEKVNNDIKIENITYEWLCNMQQKINLNNYIKFDCINEE